MSEVEYQSIISQLILDIILTTLNRSKVNVFNCGVSFLVTSSYRNRNFENH